ncbi:MAG: FAD-dependent oxidoreductase [Spirochaetaceae bacterium]|nr:FAD-dependent oxidoreductase [Spirochaetaceae bacterium]
MKSRSVKLLLWGLAAGAIILVLGTVSVIGCASTGKSQEVLSGQTFTPGTYTASGTGNYGDVEVIVEFSRNRIEKITIGTNMETEAIAAPSFEKIPQAIIEGQTLAVDVITGASNSSRAVLEAVAAAVAMAGGNAEALRNRQVAARGPGAEIVKQTDVLIIGGGGAGLAAAVNAAETGAKVILIEKAPSLGGNTIRAGGAYNAVDPDRQKAVKMTAPLLDELRSLLTLQEPDMGDYAPVLRTLKGQIRTYLAGDTSVLFDSVELHIIQTYLGGKRTDRNGYTITGNPELVRILCANSLDAMLWLESQGLRFDNPIGTVLGALWPRTHGNNQPVGTGFINTLAASAKKLGVEIILECKGEELIRSGDRIGGVNGHLSDGTPIRINASRGVVLTTGGYGENREMRAQYNTYWPSLPLTMPSTNTPNATGDGIVMGLAAGAELVGMGFVQLMPSSHPETGALSGGVWGSAEEQVFVNGQGKRFVNEYAERDVLASAALEQPNGLFYIIGDQITSGNPQSGGKNGWGDDIDTLVATKSIYKANTLADLEAQLGIPPGNLQAEIARYNGFIDAGVDQDFGKRNFGAKISVPPFYATPRSPSVHHTMGGLAIDGSTRVLNTSGKPIPGLYAAGEVTGGIHAGNRLGGNALVDTQVFGRIAGASAAAGL